MELSADSLKFLIEQYGSHKVGWGIIISLSLPFIISLCTFLYNEWRSYCSNKDYRETIKEKNQQIRLYEIELLSKRLKVDIDIATEKYDNMRKIK